MGATTRIGLLTGPLRDRFGIPLKLNFYDVSELKKVVSRASSLLKVSISADGANEIARRARGTPRIANRLLRRVRDFAEAEGATIDKASASRALKRLEIDEDGLDALDRRIAELEQQLAATTAEVAGQTLLIGGDIEVAMRLPGAIDSA